MAVDKDNRNGQWRYRKRAFTPDGRVIRISGTPQINTKRAAQDAERAHIERVLKGLPPKRELPKEVPTFETFVKTYLHIANSRNKASDVATKASTFKHHLIPFFGRRRLDQITFEHVQDFTAKKIIAGLSKKTVNNHLSILRTTLMTAKKRGIISQIPEVEWLKAAKPEFDFYDFEEADKLVEAAKHGRSPEIATMIFLALRTGMRHGELLALRWVDVDLERARLSVRQAVARGIVATPKSNRSRHIPLSPEVVSSLKEHRHLRGPLVFCNLDGGMLTRHECRKPLLWACRRAGLRELGWHALRHAFASHLVMRNASLKAIQELLGHATIEMTMRYAHLAPHVTKNAVELLDKVHQPLDTFGQQVANKAVFRAK